MPFPSALTVDQVNALRGTNSAVPSYYAVELVAFLPNTIVFQATISADSPVIGSTALNSYAQVSYNSVVVGAHTAIVADELILIGTDIRNPLFTGRARADNSGVVSTGTTVNISETSDPITAGMTIWCIRDFRISDRLARATTSGTTVTQFKDYELSYQLSPAFIHGLQSSYGAICDGTGKITLSFAPVATAITSGATIASWLWTVPSGMTITSGSTTTQNITATFDSGFSEWVFVQVTDSNGKVGVFRFWVISIAADYSNVVTLSTGGLSFNNSGQGYSATIPAFAGVNDLLDNTLLVALDVEYYNGEQAFITSNVKFTGRIRVEHDTTTPDETYGLLKKTDYDIETVTDMLARIEHLPFTLTTKDSPTVWDQLTNLTLPRAIAYSLWWHSTLLTLHSITFDNFDLTWAYPLLPTQGGNVLAIIQDLAVSYNAEFQAEPTGEVSIHRNALYLTPTERLTIPTVAHFTSTDWLTFEVSVSQVDDAGKVQASGGVYNSHSGNVTPYLSIAPGSAQGIGQNVDNFTRQVLQTTFATFKNAQNELNYRAGQRYAIVQRKQPIASVTFPPGYNFIVPTSGQWYTFTVDASENTGGRVYTTDDRWLCQSVSITQDNSIGAKTISATFQLESTGFRGQTLSYPAVNSQKAALPPVPTTPSIPSLPPLPSITMPTEPTIPDEPPYVVAIPRGDGNCVVVWSDTQAWLTNNLLLTSHPLYTEITPPNVLDTFTCFQWVGNGRPDAYALSNDGTDTRFHYCANVFANAPVWIDTDLTGLIYTTIRVNATSGKVYLCGVSLTTGSATDGWSVSVGTEDARDADTITATAVFIGGGKYEARIQTADFNQCCEPIITFLSGSYTVSGAVDCGLENTDDANINFAWAGGVEINCVVYQSPSPFQILFDVTGCGGLVAQTNIAFSSDFGATFGSPQTLGTSLSDDVGFDTIKIGPESIVAEVGQIDISTTDGGSYSSYGSALPTNTSGACLVVPRYQFGSSTSGNINTTTPQYLVGGALGDDNKAILKVTSSGGTFTDITPNISGDYGVALTPNCLTMPYKKGTVIVGVLIFDTDMHLVVSSTSGSGWTDRGTLGAHADYVRMRKSDLLCKQLFYVDETPQVSQNLGATIISKSSPTGDTLRGIEPYSSV